MRWPGRGRKPTVDEITVVEVPYPHEPSADARRAAVLEARMAVIEDRIVAAGERIFRELQEQLGLDRDDRETRALALAWDIQELLCIRAPGAPEPPVVPGPRRT